MNEEPFVNRYLIFMHGKWDNFGLRLIGALIGMTLLFSVLFLIVNHWIYPPTARGVFWDACERVIASLYDF